MSKATLNKVQKEYTWYLVNGFFEKILSRKLKSCLEKSTSIHEFFQNNHSLKSILNPVQRQKVEKKCFKDYAELKLKPSQCIFLLDFFYNEQVKCLTCLFGISFIHLRYGTVVEIDVDASKASLKEIIQKMDITEEIVFDEINSYNIDSVISITENIWRCIESSKNDLKTIIDNIKSCKKSKIKIRQFILPLETKLTEGLLKLNDCGACNNFDSNLLEDKSNHLNSSTYNPLVYVNKFKKNLQSTCFKVLITDIDYNSNIYESINWNIIIHLKNDKLPKKYFKKNCNELDSLCNSSYLDIYNEKQSFCIFASGAKTFGPIITKICNFFNQLKNCFVKGFKIKFFQVNASSENKDNMKRLFVAIQEELEESLNQPKLTNFNIQIIETKENLEYDSTQFKLDRLSFEEIILSLPESKPKLNKSYENAYTQNHFNYIRFWFVLNIVSVEVLKSLLKKEIYKNTKQDPKVQKFAIRDFFQCKQSDFEEGITMRYFSTQQYHIVYPNHQATNTLENFDISLCTAVFRNLTTHKNSSDWKNTNTENNSFVSCLSKLLNIRNSPEAAHFKGKNGIKEMNNDCLRRYKPEQTFKDSSIVGRIEFCIWHLYKDEPDYNKIKLEINKYLNEDLPTLLENEEKFLLLEKEDRNSLNIEKIKEMLLKLEADRSSISKVEIFDSKYSNIFFNNGIREFLSFKKNSRYFKVLVLCNCDKYSEQEKNQISNIVAYCNWNILIDLGKNSLDSTDELHDKIKLNLNARNRKMILIVTNQQNSKLDDNELDDVRTGQQMLYLMVNGCSNLGVNSPKNLNDFNHQYAKYLSRILKGIDDLKVIFMNLFIDSQAAFTNLCKDVSYIQLTNEILNQFINILDENDYDINNAYLINIIPSDKDKNNEIKKILCESFESLTEKLTNNKNENRRCCSEEFAIFEEKLANLNAVNDCKIILPYMFNFDNYTQYSRLIEVYYETIGSEIQQNSDEEKKALTIEYLKGKQITPQVIYLNEDGNYHTCIKRNIISEIEKDIREKINLTTNSFENNCFVIEYEHSSGATTLGCLLLYKFHNEHPCLLLKSMDMDHEEKRNEALTLISKNTLPKTLIILIDDNVVSKQSIEISKVFRISEMLHGLKHKSCIIFLKKLIPNSSQNKNLVTKERKKYLNKSYFLTRKLAQENEKDSFTRLYNQFTQNPISSKLKKVHLYGLFSFGEDYAKIIESIIRETIQQFNPVKLSKIKNALFMVASVKKYTNSRFPARLLALMLDVDTIDLLDSIEDEKEHSGLIDILAVNDKNEFTPYHVVVIDSLEKVIIEDDLKEHFVQSDFEKNKLKKFYDLIVTLIGKTINTKSVKYKLMENVCEILKFVFISYNENKERHFSLFIETLKLNFNDQDISEMISKLIDEIRSWKNIYPFLVMVLGKFYFYEMKDHKKGLNTIKKAFFNEIDNFADLFNNKFLVKNSNSDIVHPNILTAYAHMIKAFLKRCFNIKNSEPKLELNQVLILSEDAFHAYEKARKLNNQDTDIDPFIGEIRLRYRLVEYFFKSFCQYQQKIFSKKLNDSNFILIKESENKLKGLLDLLEQKVIKHNIVLEQDEANVFNFSFMMLKFRLDLKAQDLDKIHNLDMCINVEYLLKNFNWKWQDLNQDQLKIILEKSVKQIESNTFYSAFRDLIIGIIYAQKFEDLKNIYNFEKALEYTKLWNTHFPDESDPYFYIALFKLVYEIKNKNDENILRDNIDMANKNFQKCREKSTYKNKYKKDYLSLKFGVTKQKGLALEFFDQPDNDKWEIFNGRFQKETNKQYYALVSKPECDFNKKLRAFYQPNLSSKPSSALLQSDLESNDLFEFSLLIRRDKIYMINPKKMIPDKKPLKN